MTIWAEITLIRHADGRSYFLCKLSSKYSQCGCYHTKICYFSFPPFTPERVSFSLFLIRLVRSPANTFLLSFIIDFFSLPSPGIILESESRHGFPGTPFLYRMSPVLRPTVVGSSCVRNRQSAIRELVAPWASCQESRLPPWTQLSLQFITGLASMNTKDTPTISCP